MTKQRTLAEIDDHYGIKWRFDTARYTVAFWAEAEDMAPEDNFEFAEDIEFAKQNEPAHWFCAFVGVFKGEYDDTSQLLAYDVLGGCSYNSFSEFLGHRSGLYVGRMLRTGAYFPDMVKTAISEARAAELKLQFVEE